MKRISFSLDESWAEWCCRRHAVRRSDGGTPLYLNPQKCVNTILTHSCDCWRDAASCTGKGKGERDRSPIAIADHDNVLL